MNKFWMVYSPEMSAPRTQHTSFQSAAGEAQRLANNNPGKHYFVMEATHCAVGRVTIEYGECNAKQD